MKKFKTKATLKALELRAAAQEKAAAAKERLADRRGSVSEHAIIIIIGVVIGAILLTAMVVLVNTVIMPSVEGQVTSMFGMANSAAGGGGA